MKIAQNLGDSEEKQTSENDLLPNLEENPVGEPHSSIRKYDLTLVSSGCPNKIPDWMASADLFSHGSGSWKSTRSECQPGWLLGRTLFLARRRPPALCALTRWHISGSTLPGICCYKGTNPVERAPPSRSPLNPMTSHRPRLQTPSSGGGGGIIN